MTLLVPGANLSFHMEVPLESEIPDLDPLFPTSSRRGFGLLLWKYKREGQEEWNRIGY